MISQVSYGMWSSIKYIDRDEPTKMKYFDNLIQITYLNNSVILNIGRDGIFREVASNDHMCRLMDANNFINTGVDLQYSFHDDDRFSEIIERKSFLQNLQGSMTAIYEQRLKTNMDKKTGEKNLVQIVDHFSNKIYKTYTELDLRELM